MSPETDIGAKVLAEIRSRSVSMRSRLYFKCRMGLINALTVAIFFLCLFTVSYIFFNIRNDTYQYLIAFGNEGGLTFTLLFPWFTLMFALVLLVVLEALLRRFTASYRVPALRLLLWTVIVVVAASSLIELTPLHSYLSARALGGDLPVLGPLYQIDGK
jgi:hypothetical protein